MRTDRRGKTDFYSRPCGRGDVCAENGSYFDTWISTHAPAGGATGVRTLEVQVFEISTHAPAGGATLIAAIPDYIEVTFLLTPLREGRPNCGYNVAYFRHFYSRPCGRGDYKLSNHYDMAFSISTHAPAGGATKGDLERFQSFKISTHAPAGGATAIFHKSVMRFCGKLPKDDTVLCLASFGFPRRDPKAVYLAWISCANLPQKCVREGLALKDQGTSCFHEGLASHAFDPVLV